MATVYALPGRQGEAPTLFVDRESGPLLVLPTSGPPEECWSLPTTAEELTTRETVIDEVLEALAELPRLSRTGREAVEKMLAALPR
jgi:hypothetical protein